MSGVIIKQLLTYLRTEIFRAATVPNIFCFRELLEQELEAVGIRLNKRKPNIYFKVTIRLSCFSSSTCAPQIRGCSFLKRIIHNMLLGNLFTCYFLEVNQTQKKHEIFQNM